MTLEHIGLNVAEPQKVMDWWCANLGFTQTHPAFIVDSSGRMAIEFYDVDADAARLVAAGATLVETVHREGFDMTMLRDPFGIAVQFVKRAKPILL